MPIAVVSLEKLTANAELRHLYLWVTADGTVLYVEGYEDGTYTDLLELRAYTQVRVQASNASAIIAKCVRDEDGEIQIFPIFRPKFGH
jgi:hypothetical protein